MGIERRQYFSRRTFFGAAFLFAPGFRMGPFSHPYQESLYVRVGNTSWRRNHGRAGKAGGAGGIERWSIEGMLSIARRSIGKGTSSTRADSPSPIDGAD